MEALFGLVILIVILVAVVGGIAGFVARRAKGSKPIISPNWEPPKADRLPYAKKKYLFSVAERSFYEVLKRLVPAEYTVFAKVRLADVVYVTKGTGAWQSHFNRISGKHLDFVLCNRDLAPVVVIELDDSSHDEEERQSRDGFLDQALLAAALPILHVPAKRGYIVDEVRQLLSPHLPARSSVAMAHPDARYMGPATKPPAA
jgi:Protein of unknown function (DUF2726)